MHTTGSARRQCVAVGARTLAFAFAAIATIAHCGNARADGSSDTVVVAKSGPDAILLWKATPVVAAIVAERIPDDAANDRLERAALRAVAPVLGRLRHATTVTLRVLYDETGAVSPVYGDATFTGVERYAAISFSAARGRSQAQAWQHFADAKELPAWVRFTVVGKLPPR